MGAGSWAYAPAGARTTSGMAEAGGGRVVHRRIATESQARRHQAARGNRAPAASLSVRLLRRWTLLRLVYQHNGDAIADRIPPAARITDEAIFCEPNGGLAHWTCEDVEQFLIDHPESSPLGRSARWALMHR